MRELREPLRFKLLLSTEAYIIDIKCINKYLLIKADFNIDNYQLIQNNFSKFIKIIREIFPNFEKRYEGKKVYVNEPINENILNIDANLVSGECKVFIRISYEDFIDIAKTNNIYVPIS